jgi:WD40 repeat protein
LVTGGADQQLKGWDVKTREQVMLLGKHTAAVGAAAWVSSGVFAATESGTLLRYSDFKPHSGAQSSDSANERRFEAADVGLCSVCAGGERVFAGTEDGRVLGWNKDGKMVINLGVLGASSTTAR